MDVFCSAGTRAPADVHVGSAGTRALAHAMLAVQAEMHQ